MTVPTDPTFPHHDLVSLAEWSADELRRVFDVARALKADPDAHRGLLAGKRLAMVFEKDSLRTRFTFDLGMQDLGGSAVYLDHRDARLGSRESVPDMARNLERCELGREYRKDAYEYDWDIDELSPETKEHAIATKYEMYNDQHHQI